QENLILLEINRPLLLTERMVRTFHREWMASEDHRRTILSPQATHTGSDFELYQDGDYYTMAVVSEFICERGDYSRLPDRVRSGELLEFSGQLISGVEADYIGIGLQQSPVKMSPQQLNEL